MIQENESVSMLIRLSTSSWIQKLIILLKAPARNSSVTTSEDDSSSETPKKKKGSCGTLRQIPTGVLWINFKINQYKMLKRQLIDGCSVFHCACISYNSYIISNEFHSDESVHPTPYFKDIFSLLNLSRYSLFKIMRGLILTL